MDDINYKNAVEAVKADLIEAATEMGLDVEWYKQEIIADGYCLNFLSAEIAEKMLELSATFSADNNTATVTQS